MITPEAKNVKGTGDNSSSLFSQSIKMGLYKHIYGVLPGAVDFVWPCVQLKLAQSIYIKLYFETTEKEREELREFTGKIPFTLNSEFTLKQNKYRVD